MLDRILSRAYGALTGVYPNALKKAHRDIQGAIETLSTFVCVELEQQDFKSDRDADELGTLLKRHGSDKSTKHNYHLLYAALLKSKRHSPLRILEIGIGTNDPTIESNMGVDGKPGASLRAFRDWATQAEMCGADYDRNTLFTEERIRTVFVDQRDPHTFTRVPGSSFDLIIDDGLHTPWANFNTMAALLPKLADDGVMVAEDILESYLPLWRVACALLSEKYECRLVRMKLDC